MNNNLTEIIFILDRSGSMASLAGDTISGYNAFIANQKNQNGEANLTTILFDNHYEILHDGVNIKNVKPLTENDYFTRGMTALYDAIGKTINSVGERLNKTPEDERPGKVIFVITTDGYENASKEFSANVVKNMITHQKDKYSWEFIFLGANIDSESVGNSIGIDESRSINYTPTSKGVGSMMFCMCDTVSDYRSTGTIAEDLKTKIEQP